MSAEVARTKGCADSRRTPNAPISGCPPGKSAGSSRKKFRSSWALEELCGPTDLLRSGLRAPRTSALPSRNGRDAALPSTVKVCRAASLAAIPAGESPASVGVQSTL